MSIRIMSLVWETGPQKQAERFVLLALADYANDAGECWPAVQSICRKVCMTDRGVQKVIRRLEADGWLEINTGNGRHGCNQYTIKNPERGSPRTTFPPNKSAETPNDVPLNPERGSPEPSRTIKEPSEVIDTPASILSHHADPKAVDSFLAYRRKHKSKALTETGAARLAVHLREINEGGGDASDALAMAEERGWASVQPDWYFNAKGTANDNRNRNSAADDPTLRAIAAVAARTH